MTTYTGWLKTRGKKEYYRHIYADNLTYTLVVTSSVPKCFSFTLFSPSVMVKHQYMKKPKSLLAAMLETEQWATVEGFSLTASEGVK